MSGYAHPEALVETQWVADHLNDPNVRIVESDEDLLLYDTGHIPGAVKIDWVQDLNDPVVRDYLDSDRFAALMRVKGISNDTTVVLYGDKHNWWATYAFWVFKLFGHRDVRIMNGGRAKWIAEGRPLTREVPSYPPGNYVAPPRNDAEIRAFRDQVLEFVRQRKGVLVDVRSPQEYTGERTHMPDYPQEGTLRGGHIPTAVNIPWARAVNEDSTFKSVEELRELYAAQGVTPDKEVIAYCRIGERSSHTWFVLTYLLGFPNVRNYDGSWTEWGNSVGLPIEKNV
ncbi:MAG TPA: sulfurtransferase [Chloroflexus aurantiacus]|jgi:thiosulfate/3-mercaptopyruvate sulfurtransferase|uniref:Sulfurtransferase n=1 Tax=Chloroflexus aurantiacus (strain ATCC 29366 / DSM 635 / J-10-fl) TaxID=324602 RepID=A9W9Y9_CHLAA|nr:MULTISPECIES: sulfurtransferase [Chloroflexus]ABY36671.1 Rhodanese domain protein [Chloroflexus aurantiacus J-10-fl]RMG53200.1 MAG: sulfurtransferase [Chloroflexota bacterium]HBW67677.1 sulfurtransferase [Chloroflexus aurantiacus]